MPISSLVKSKESHSFGDSSEHNELSQPVLDFLAALNNEKLHISDAEGEPVIHVSSVVSRAAIFYERLRYSVDYHEEHLLRRHALQRILRRRFEAMSGVDGAARSLLVELVHAQYLKNDSVPEAVIPKVQSILDRYAEVLRLVSAAPLKDKSSILHWFCGVAAAELDAFLVPAPEEAALVNLVRVRLEKDKPFVAWPIPDDQRKILEYVASYRALFALDLPKIRYLLLRRFMPEWPLVRSAQNISLSELLKHHKNIEAAIVNPGGEKFFKILRQRSLVFHTLHDIVKDKKDKAKDILSNKKSLEMAAEEICQRYYKAARVRLYKSAVRSTVYIFLTKMLVALLVEGPFESFLYGTVAVLPILINLSFPPGLMILLTVTTRLPGQKNTKSIVRYLDTILNGSDKRVFSELAPPGKASAISGSALSLIYILASAVTFGLVASFLLKIDFTTIGIAFFLFFLSVVSFFALRIRRPIHDLFVERRRDNVLISLLNFFSLPILKAGRWISLTSARFNVFLYLFDYFLEAPIKRFLLVSEDVIGFFQEKKEDIV